MRVTICSLGRLLRIFVRLQGLVLLAPLLHGANAFTYLERLSSTDDVTALAVSSNGTVVGRELDVTLASAVSWDTAGMITNLPVPSFDTGSTAYAIANGGIIVGRFKNASAVLHAFKLEQGNFTDLGNITGFAGNLTQATAISADGQVIAGVIDTMAGSTVFHLENDTIDYGVLPSMATTARVNGVSADGSVLAGYATLSADSNSHAFRWTNSGGNYTDLGNLGGNQTYANGITADGTVVVGTSQDSMNNEQAFQWTQGGGMVALAMLANTDNGEANGISTDGKLIVGRAHRTGGGYAMVFWDATGVAHDLAAFLTDHGVPVGGTFWTANAVSGAGNGTYTIVGYDYSGSYMLPFRAIIDLAPNITLQPAPALVASGGNVDFALNATGTGNLTYQWYFQGHALADGVGVTGATTATLGILKATVKAAGSYYCMVTDAQGYSQSRTVLLQINPMFITQPGNLKVKAGNSAVFKVKAVGTAPLKYQWFHGSKKMTPSGHVAGVASATLTIKKAAKPDAGKYHCVVTNAKGTAASANATLTVK